MPHCAERVHAFGQNALFVKNFAGQARFAGHFQGAVRECRRWQVIAGGVAQVAGQARAFGDDVSGCGPRVCSDLFGCVKFDQSKCVETFEIVPIRFVRGEFVIAENRAFDRGLGGV